MVESGKLDGDDVIPPIEFANREYLEGLAQSIVAVNWEILSKRGFAPSFFVGGLYGHELVGRVESVLASVFVRVFGVSPSERYIDLFDQVSVFAEYLAKDHVFTDGNKRTTVKVSLGLIMKQGIELDLEDSDDPEDNEVYTWIEAVVTGRRTRQELADMLRSHAVL